MNFHSPEWLEVRKEIEKRIASLDQQNRGSLDFAQTCELRGQIKSLLSLRDWKAATEPEAEIDYLR